MSSRVGQIYDLNNESVDVDIVLVSVAVWLPYQEVIQCEISSVGKPLYIAIHVSWR